MRKRRIIYTVGLAMLLTSSCDAILDVTPKQSIDSTLALRSPEAVEAALNSIYAYLRPSSQYGRDLIAIPELLSDNAAHTGNPTDLQAESRNLPGAHIDHWQSSYYAINEINNLLAALEPLQATQDFKDRIAGQAYFLRALIYHNLMRVYAYDPTAIVEEVNKGGVPIMTKPVLKVEDIEYKGRESIENVYRFIYSDLESAWNLLQGKTIGGNNPEYYASAGAAAALFTRVALYNGDYERVIAEAENALSSGVGTFQSNGTYVSAWRSVKHPESMFELVYQIADNIGVNESLRATFTSRNSLSSATFANRGNVVVSDELYSLYDNNDVRKQLIIKGLGRNNTRNEMTKFISKNGTANLDNVPVIRISEVYLNRAEAYARTNQDLLARIDLNRIRTRAGLSPVPETLTGQALLDEILLQRRLELAFEGHRFFDLKRLGMDIVKPSGTIEFEDFKILARIPITEVQRNPNLEQNFGY